MVERLLNGDVAQFVARFAEKRTARGGENQLFERLIWSSALQALENRGMLDRFDSIIFTVPMVLIVNSFLPILNAG